jgi:hypothetical protein
MSELLLFWHLFLCGTAQTLVMESKAPAPCSAGATFETMTLTRSYILRHFVTLPKRLFEKTYVKSNKCNYPNLAYCTQRLY